MADCEPSDQDVNRLRSLLREELAAFREALVLELRNTQMHVPNRLCGTGGAPDDTKNVGGVDEPQVPLGTKHVPEEKPHLNMDKPKEQLAKKARTASSRQLDGSCDAFPVQEVQGTPFPTSHHVNIPGILEDTDPDSPNSSYEQLRFGSVNVQNHFVTGSTKASDLDRENGWDHATSGQQNGNLQKMPGPKMKVGAFGGLTSKAAMNNLTEVVYDVSVYYHDKGCAQALARNDKFGNFTLFMIVLNTVYIGIDQDNNPSDFIFHAPWPFQVFENFFALFFCSELLLRFSAFKRKRDCLRDVWFKIDSSLVFLMICEMWLLPLLLTLGTTEGGKGGPNASFLRLLRLLRISRMVRALRFMPELVSMIKGMRAAAQAVFTSLAMVLALIYIFAIVMNMILKDEAAVYMYFADLTKTMWTLGLDGVLADSPGTVIRLLASLGTWSGRASVLIFMLFMILSCFFLMNMLIGVLCEVVNTVSEREKDEAAVNLVRETILLLLKQFDSDGNGSINQKELRMVMEDPRAVEVLKSLEVDVTYLEELQGMLFMEPDSEVAIQSALELLLSCRGSLPTTVKHMVSGQAFTRWMVFSALKQQEENFAAQLRGVTKKIIAFVEAGAKPAPAIPPAILT